MYGERTTGFSEGTLGNVLHRRPAQVTYILAAKLEYRGDRFATGDSDMDTLGAASAILELSHPKAQTRTPQVANAKSLPKTPRGLPLGP